jgi:hypothetical protein
MENLTFYKLGRKLLNVGSKRRRGIPVAATTHRNSGAVPSYEQACSGTRSNQDERLENGYVNNGRFLDERLNENSFRDLDTLEKITL